MLSSESTETHRYTYAGGKLLRETILTFTASGIITNEILDFRYDNAGLPYALIYQEGSAATQTYYYITNLQGDVMYMVDAVGNQVAEYECDPYGKIIRVVDATVNAGSSNGKDGTEDVQPYANIPTEPEDTTKTLAELNPLRYRGYYYDTETSFYYLQSRYYDPIICRFLNADGYTCTGQNIVSYNIFAYCGNDPINAADPSGHIPNRAVMMTDGSTISDYSRAWANKALTELEERRKQEQRGKTKEKIVGVGKAFWNSLDCYVGVGQGLYGGTNIGSVGIEVGFRGDYFAVHLEDGEFTVGQETYVGVTGTVFIYDVGIAGSEFTPNNGMPESEEWVLLNKNQDSITIFGVSGYFWYFGGTINIGFNPANFCDELWEVFYG